MAQSVFERPMKNVSVVDIIYPVGSIYMSAVNLSPATLFGGTWTALEDRFLVAAGSVYSSGSTGGSVTKTITASGTVGGHALTTNEIPSHNHGLSEHTHDGDFTVTEAGSHSHATRGCNSGPNDSGSGGYGRAVKYMSNDARDNSNAMLSAGSHTHTITGTSGAASGNTDSVGSGTAHNHTFTGSSTNVNIVPPYMAVYIWKRTA